MEQKHKDAAGGAGDVRCEAEAGSGFDLDGFDHASDQTTPLALNQATQSCHPSSAAALR